MAISYASTPFTFVDSQFGSASASNIKSLVNVVVDRRYHKEVQKKTFFQSHGMIGADVYSEGDFAQTAPGLPVVRKTDLTAQPGDTIKMGLRKNLSFAISTGTTGGTQLVDSEVGWDLDNQLVKVEQFRQGVRTNGGINSQRNPYEPFEQTEVSLLSDWSAQQKDTSILYAMHYGFGHHLLRKYGHTNLAPTAVINTLYGNDTTMTTSRTIANMLGAGTDNVKPVTFEIGEAYCRQAEFDPISVGGDSYWVALISPKAKLALYQDATFRSAVQHARERSVDNPLFKYGDGLIYGNCIIFTYDKIRTILGGNNPAGLTVSNDVITEAAYTGIGGGLASTDLHATYFLGANAVVWADGMYSMAERIRSENDYGNIIGRAVDEIFGTKRADWKNEGGTIDINQSLLQIVNSTVL